MKNVFSINNNFISKHKVLKILSEHWLDGEEKTNFGRSVEPLGRSLSVLQLVSKSNIPKQKLDNILIFLKGKELIKVYELDADKNQKNHKYIVTDLGQEYYSDNHFLNQRGVFYRKFFVEYLGIIIALFAVLYSVFLSIEGSEINSKIKKLQTEQQHLEHKNSDMRKQVDSLYQTLLP